MIHGPPAVLAGQHSRGDAALTRLCKVMDKKHGRKPAEKGVKAKRVFRLKASLKPSSQIEATAALSSSTKSDDRIPSPNASAQEGATAAPAVDAAADDNDDGDGGHSSCAIDTAGDQESLALPRPTPSPSDLLLSMEQQLRAGVTPTLPTSAHERADLLASSFLPNGNGNGNSNSGSGSSAGPAAPALSSTKQSPDISSFVVPITPSLTKKRPRPFGKGGGEGGVGRGGEPGGRGCGAAASQPRFVAVKEWEFSGKKRGAAAVQKPKFFSALWMMMVAFGDPRGSVTCKCAGRGKKTCPCIEGVAAMESMVKTMAVRLVEVCREWSSPKQIRVEHIRMAMPGEMREYMAWKEAHSKRGTTNKAERGADLRLEEVEEGSDDDDDDDDDDGNDDEEDKDNDDLDDRGNTATPEPASGAGKSAAKRETKGGVVGVTGVGVGVGERAEAATAAVAVQAAVVAGSDAGAGDANEEEVTRAGAAVGKPAVAATEGLGNGASERKPWQKQLKMKKTRRSHQQQRQEQEEQQQGEDDTGDNREWAAEEEDVAIRMTHRKMFADERTAAMKEEDYVDHFFEFRKAFFLSVRAGGGSLSRGGGKKKCLPGSRGYLARYLELKPDSREAGNKKLLQALAFMMYDFVGRVVEAALRNRTGGRLICGNSSDPMLSAEEIIAAGATVPPLSGREQRENARAFRAANPDGIVHNRPLGRFPVGLEHRGNPLRWPRNTIEGGRMLVEGGEVVDTSDKSLAEEAMALLESDFADF